MLTWTKTKYDVLDQKYPKHMKVLRYIISGGTAAVVDLAGLYILTDLMQIWYVLSAILAFIIAFGVSFTLQKYWTFRDHSNEGVVMQGSAYFVVNLINLGLNTLLVYLFTDRVHVHYMLSQIIAAGLIAILSFFVYQKLIFNRKPQVQ